ncbi:MULTISPECIES: hypothetical protein [Pseudomonas]|jgi:hypothetical protein|uniref:hypothetical protein n=1 Tax=Pseudomonas TaxID=286 RepID=UPI0012D2DECD|nr:MULTISPECIES: hypothetical protein [Pseudomonas]
MLINLPPSPASRLLQVRITPPNGSNAINTEPCRSWLASDGDMAGDNDVDQSAAIASKPAPAGSNYPAEWLKRD